MGIQSILRNETLVADLALDGFVINPATGIHPGMQIIAGLRLAMSLKSTLPLELSPAPLTLAFLLILILPFGF